MKNLKLPLRILAFFLILTGLLLITNNWNVLLVSAKTLRDESPTPTVETEAAVQASDSTATPQPSLTTAQPNPHTSNDCLACHGNEKMVGKFPNGETISLYVVPSEQKDSSHAQKGFSCEVCHQDQKIYPHKNSSTQSCSVCHYQISGNPPPGDQLVFDLPYEDARALGLSFGIVCGKCHSNKISEVEGSVHTRLQQEGNRYAPGCADCHSAHKISDAGKLMVAKVCSQCHRAEYLAYKSSVHGEALEGKLDPNVPTCADCHGYHKVTGPSDDDFRDKAAVDMCGKCHANKALIKKYGLSPDILSTYLDDVHAQTDLLGRIDNSGYPKATCYDCHGTHYILSPKNPYSKVYPDNLQKTCQQCHKDANIRFPQAWLSHKTPSSTTLSGLYFTNRISLVAVFGLVAVIILFVILDFRRRKAEKIVVQPKQDS
jgi:hypothetical protein